MEISYFYSYYDILKANSPNVVKAKTIIGKTLYILYMCIFLDLINILAEVKKRSDTVYLGDR